MRGCIRKATTEDTWWNTQPLPSREAVAERLNIHLGVKFRTSLWTQQCTSRGAYLCVLGFATVRAMTCAYIDSVTWTDIAAKCIGSVEGTKESEPVVAIEFLSTDSYVKLWELSCILN